MEELIERCAGIDVGQAEVVVCARVPDRVTGRATELVETYGTTTPDLLELHDWSCGGRPGCDARALSLDPPIGREAEALGR